MLRVQRKDAPTHDAVRIPLLSKSNLKSIVPSLIYIYLKITNLDSDGGNTALVEEVPGLLLRAARLGDDAHLPKAIRPADQQVELILPTYTSTSHSNDNDNDDDD